MGERYGRVVWVSRARLLEFSTCLFDTMAESPRPHSVSNDHSVTGQPSIACATADLLFGVEAAAKRRMFLSLFTSQMTFVKEKKETRNEMKNGVCALLYYIVHLITVLRNCIFSRFAMAGGDWSFGYVRMLHVKSVKRFNVVPLRPRDLLAIPNTYVRERQNYAGKSDTLRCVTLMWMKDLEDGTEKRFETIFWWRSQRFELHLFLPPFI